ncbi:MAG: hypothetical protein AB1813_16395 [Verrucomicrobiota bacterium]
MKNHGGQPSRLAEAVKENRKLASTACQGTCRTPNRPIGDRGEAMKPGGTNQNTTTTEEKVEKRGGRFSKITPKIAFVFGENRPKILRGARGFKAAEMLPYWHFRNEKRRETRAKRVNTGKTSKLTTTESKT